jgi:hypothetical protein
MRIRLKDRIAKLEVRRGSALRPKKRCVPDWLQSDMESQGYVFDASGQLISATDPMRSDQREQPVEKGYSDRYRAVNAVRMCLLSPAGQT